MKESIRHKLESVRDRFEELAGLLADPEVIGDQNQFRELSKEYSRVEPVVKLFSDYESVDRDIAAAEEMAADKDDEVRQMGEEELATLREQHRARGPCLRHRDRDGRATVRPGNASRCPSLNAKLSA